MKFAAAILLLTLIAVQSSEAIKCYQCLPGTDCKKEVDCPGSCTTTTASTSVVGVTTTTKACSPTPIPNGCKENSVLGNTGKICACDTDLCNKGVACHVAIPLMIVAVLLGRFM
ncbi:lymphocyte antigen 6D-like [Penaeus chinensis]|uniref:lymphocyte antigen 6D-like n=1 Tax=Penaeus chinensis TaxID=139456 RepID=UPI001FB739E4|nr:lymphocyte antigen 6D-like [Penaeus chinensis]